MDNVQEWLEPTKKIPTAIVTVIILIICVASAFTVIIIFTPKAADNGSTGSGGGNGTASQNMPPTAMFTYSPSSPTVDDDVFFINMSTDIDGTIISYSWNFGDGNTSTDQNPIHKYSTAGTYSVRLTVTDNGGKTGDYEKSITIGGTGENVFQDFELNNGTPGAYFYNAWRASSAFETNIVQGGIRSVKFVVPPPDNQNNGATLGINVASPTGTIDLTNATNISLWVYDTQGNNTIELKLKDKNGTLGPGIWSSLSSVWNTWTKITWNISEYQGVDMSQIAAIELYEWNGGTYYFDTIAYK
ncbi:MAG: PKD domain-containing protein [Candidatus Hadarchaeales archaeon]